MDGIHTKKTNTALVLSRLQTLFLSSLPDAIRYFPMTCLNVLKPDMGFYTTWLVICLGFYNGSC